MDNIEVNNEFDLIQLKIGNTKKIFSLSRMTLANELESLLHELRRCKDIAEYSHYSLSESYNVYEIVTSREVNDTEEVSIYPAHAFQNVFATNNTSGYDMRNMIEHFWKKSSQYRKGVVFEPTYDNFYAHGDKNILLPFYDFLWGCLYKPYFKKYLAFLSVVKDAKQIMFDAFCEDDSSDSVYKYFKKYDNELVIDQELEKNKWNELSELLNSNKKVYVNGKKHHYFKLIDKDNIIECSDYGNGEEEFKKYLESGFHQEVKILLRSGHNLMVS